jgi:hypothetical protein
MQRLIIICAVLLSGLQALSQKREVAAQPHEFVIGRHTFIDVGPPFNFYELFVVQPAAGGGSSIEKFLLTPAGNACFQSAKIETSAASLKDSVTSLLGPENPCAIPEKDLRRELKRCKKCLVFSGAQVAMQVQCGSHVRIIRSDILDKDWFADNPNTPEHTSQTMQLLARLDHAVGLNPMDKPIFQLSTEEPANVAVSAAVKNLSLGSFDGLFKDAPDKPSDLYKATKNQPPAPTVRLVSSTPVEPTTFNPPQYPTIARIAQLEGSVVATLDVGANGAITNLTFVSGHPALLNAAKSALEQSVFPTDIPNRQVKVTLDFKLNCVSQPR